MLGNYCASNDEVVIEEGLQTVMGTTPWKAEDKAETEDSPNANFDEWWNKFDSPEVLKVEKDHVANNEPNGEDDEDEGSDGWCVNRLFHSGEAGEAAYEKAAVAFEKGMNGLDWELDIGDSFFL